MPTIDIPLPAELQEKLSQPVCIPLPEPGSVKIALPTGGTIQALADITKQIPDDCTLSFTLALQLGPFLANIDCLLKVMKVIQPLVDLVKALSTGNIAKVPEPAEKFITAVEPLVQCIADFSGGVFGFVRDLLCLIAKLLHCIADQLKSLASVLGGLALQIQSAKASGNAELQAALECAQQNGQVSARHLYSAVEPVLVLLSMAEPLLGMAGVNPIQTPAMASPEDVQGIQTLATTLEELSKTLKLAAVPLGGCS